MYSDKYYINYYYAYQTRLNNTVLNTIPLYNKHTDTASAY